MDHSLSKIEIRLADLVDIELTIDHDLRHMTELGFNNLPVHPFLTTHPFEREVFLSQNRDRWSKPIHTTGWGRSFIAIDTATNLVIGHVNFRNNLETSLHRVHLGMGIEKDYRNLGIGRKMMEKCISFCAENKIEYIDLSVFSHNLPAINLYKSFGFEEHFTKHDAFRMNDLKLDDIYMSLKF